MESFSGSQYGKGMESCVLPAATLAVSMTAKYTRQVRSAVLAELEQEYVAGARARGLSENRILFGNILKSVLLRMVTLLFLSAGSLLGGTAIVETIFMWNGVGKNGRGCRFHARYSRDSGISGVDGGDLSAAASHC